MEFMSKVVKEATVLVAAHVKEGEQLNEVKVSTKVVSYVIAKMKELVSKVAIPFCTQ